MKMIRRLQFSSVSLAVLFVFGCGSGNGGTSGPISGTGGANFGTGGVAPGAGGAPLGTGGSHAFGGGPGAAGAMSGAGAAGATSGAGGAGPVGTGGVGQGGGGAAVGGRGTDCATLPAVTDYGVAGPFSDAKMFTNVGPSGNYTMFRPDLSLGKNGFVHPLATWGNGISTTPDEYNKTLSLIASHGFVIIACNDTMAERPCLDAAMDWLVQQNVAEGPLKGKLDTSREVAIGYSWGGGAAIDVSDRPNIKATVSLHGMPPRVTMAFEAMHSPLLLFTSTGDMFVTADKYVTPNYESSKVQTFYATLKDDSAGHLYPVDMGAPICVGAILGATFGACGDDVQEHAPTIAWLRYWTCGDQAAKKLFYGPDCALCGKSPWAPQQRKPEDAWH